MPLRLFVGYMYEFVLLLPIFGVNSWYTGATYCINIYVVKKKFRSNFDSDYRYKDCNFYTYVKFTLFIYSYH